MNSYTVARLEINLGKVVVCFMQVKMNDCTSSCLRMCDLELILQSVSSLYAGISSSQDIFSGKKANKRQREEQKVQVNKLIY